MKWFVKCIKNYFHFRNRASRTEFWFFLFYWIIFYIFIIIIEGILGFNYINIEALPFAKYLPISIYYNEIGLLTILYRPLTLLPSLAVTVRRLHDINKSGWGSVLWLTPLGFILITFLCKKGDSKKNKFGERPINK